jgi:hypothetical protein
MRHTYKLYVAGPFNTPFIECLHVFFQRKFAENYFLEVIDVLTQPLLALADGVIATPTLVRYQPLPVKKWVGVLDERRLSREVI